MKPCSPLFEVWLAARVILAFVLIISVGEGALAFDCLAYKPEGARGDWHADVVAGKICWYDPNWHSFLPKPKTHVGGSRLVITEPDRRVANSQPHPPVEKSTPVETTRVENSKPDVPLENDKSEISAVSTSSPTDVVDVERAQESLGLREANPAKAATFANPSSLEFEPAAPQDPAPPEIAPQTNIAHLLIAFSMVALGTIALAWLIMKVGKQQVDFEAETDQEGLEPVDVSVEEQSQPLQPTGDEPQFVASNFHELTLAYSNQSTSER
jgi:hypothetical protein